jgi:RimJ/RimL family protein N-acetyltransferase
MPRQDRSLSTLPAIATERLDLRPLQPGDAQAFRAMTDEPGITDVVDFLPTPFLLDDATRLILGRRDGRDCFWGVWTRDPSVLIGTVGTHLVDADAIEIGYWLATGHHRLGFGSEAVSALLPVLSDAYPHRRILAECRPQNEASWRLLERLGFAADGSDGKRDGRKRLAFPRPAERR